MKKIHRPYIKLTIDELDTAYSFFRGNPDVVKRLRHELTERKKTYKKKAAIEHLLEKIGCAVGISNTSTSTEFFVDEDLGEDINNLSAHHIIAFKIEEKASNNKLTKSLREKYQSLRNGSFPLFKKHFFLQLNNGERNDVTVMPSPISVEREELNNEQWEAVERSNNEPIIAIWGPPGTGKTQVLSKIVLNFLRQDKTILIVCNTNLAVDQLLDKVCRQLDDKGDSRLYLGQIQRFGKINHEGLTSKYENCIVHNHVVAKLRRHLLAEIEELEAEQNRAQKEIELIKEKKQAYDDWDALKKKGALRVKEDEGLNERVSWTLAEIDKIKLKIKVVNAKIAKYQKWKIVRFALKIKISSLKAKLIELKNKITILENYLYKKRMLQQDSVDASSRDDIKLKAIEQRIDLAGWGKQKAKLKELYSEINRRRLKIISTEQQLECLDTTVKRKLRVSATTATSAYLKYDGTNNYDAVIIDEASMLQLSVVAFVAGMACEHVVMGGDFRQLAPINSSKDPIVKHWMGRSIFDTMGIVDAVENGRQPTNCVILKTQYRSLAKICHISNTLFYHGMLQTATGAGLLGNKIYPKFFSDSVVCIDTSSMFPTAGVGFSDIKQSSFGRFNVTHAAIVKLIVEHLLTDSNILPQDIGIVTPYTPQEELLQIFFGNSKPDTVSVGTVHKFQGSERECIVFDVTDGFGNKPGTFFKAYTLEDDGAKLLNVALTRAKSKLIILANCDYINNSPSLKGSFIQRLISIVKHKKQVADLIETHLISHVEEKNSLVTKQAMFFTDQELNNHLFFKDIKEAAESITYFAPAILKQNNNYLEKIFQEKIAAGIKIRLITTCKHDQKSRNLAPDNSQLNLYKKIGVDTEIIDHIPGKLCIIDDKLFWYCAENHHPLSKTCNSILKMRVNNQMACKQIAKAFRNFCLIDQFHKEISWGSPGKVRPKEITHASRDETKEIEQNDSSNKAITVSADAGVNVNNLESCPECGRRLVVDVSVDGKFFGCEGFPECDYQGEIVSNYYSNGSKFQAFSDFFC